MFCVERGNTCQPVSDHELPYSPVRGMPAVQHLVHYCPQSVPQWFRAGAHGSGLDGGLHTLLCVREAGLRQPMEMARGPDLHRIESGP
jgi:hypothetical protein